MDTLVLIETLIHQIPYCWMIHPLRPRFVHTSHNPRSGTPQLQGREVGRMGPHDRTCVRADVCARVLWAGG
jgi:hypothetical protein